MQNTFLDKTIDIPALIFAIYYWGFILLHPILQIAESKSTSILLSFVIILLGLFGLNILMNQKIKIEKSVFIIFLFVFFLLLLDVLFRNNDFSYKYLYQFTYSGLIPSIFLSQVKSSDKLLYYFSVLASITFILYAYDPINNYILFSDYMSFGFNFAMPAFLGIFSGFHYLRIRWMSLLEVICFIEILLFANRTALLSVIIFVLFYYLFIGEKTKKKLLILIPIGLFVIILCTNIAFIIDTLYEVVYDLGYYSYALTAMQYYFHTQDIDALFSGRFDIWGLASIMISEKPLLGHGMGSFEARYGTYSHNIFLDIMLFYGIIGSIVFFSILIISGWNILKLKNSTKVLGIIFFCLWFPKLLFSTYFYEDMGFWSFIAFSFIRWKDNCIRLKSEEAV